jgi:hypothetical protein
MSASDQTRAAARDLAVYRRYLELRGQHPHAAAVLLSSEADAIKRGASIATGQPTPEALAAVDEFGRQRGAREATDITAFRQWRDLRATNPHAAALLMGRDADAIQRGRSLDTEPPEPPQAA